MTDAMYTVASYLKWTGVGLFGGAVAQAAQVPSGAIIGGLAGIIAAWITADGRRKDAAIADLKDRIRALEREREEADSSKSGTRDCRPVPPPASG